MREKCEITRARRAGRLGAEARRMAFFLACGLVLLASRPAGAEPFYRWQFSEWREVEHMGGLAAILVPEEPHEQYGDYVLEEWDLLASTFFQTPAYMNAVGHSNGNVFWAKAIAPLRGGVAGNTIGGEALISVAKEYVRVADGPYLRFTYSAAHMEVVDFGSGRPPWFSPSAKIEMDVTVRDFTERQRWGMHQSAIARADLGLDSDDVLDDIWVLDLYGEIRGEEGVLLATEPRWEWDCDTCGEPAYGIHRPKLAAPYTENIILDGVPMHTGFTVQFDLLVSARDRGQGETAASAFAKDPLSEDDLESTDGVTLEPSGIVEIEVPRCPLPGLDGVVCLLDGGMPPARCLPGELPTNVTRPADRARDLVDAALAAPTDKKRRSLVKRLVNSLRAADRALARRQNAKRGAKPSVLCGADTHGVLQHAMARAGSVVCPPSAGLLEFGAASYEASESAGSVTLEITRTGGTAGKVIASIEPGDSSATLGVDWERPEPIVVFKNRESGPRTIAVPILDDHAGDPDETVTLRLATAHDCSTGAQATTEIRIVDDDFVPPPPTYTVGGTVEGLEGTGLVVEDAITGARVLPAADGPFTLPYDFPEGTSYEVRIATQPTGPVQVCTVANGNGTVETANVTDVVVTCETPAPSGGLDPSFGGGAGFVTATWTNVARALAVQADGKLLVLGSDHLARYLPDGTLDMSFASGGVADVKFGTGIEVEAQDVAVASDGRILVGGYVSQTFSGRSDFALARYLADGTLDATFGTGGVATTDFFGSTDRANRVLLQPDGKIVLAGHAAVVLGENDFAVARYLADGQLDPSFGSGGVATANIAGATDLASAAALQADGAIVLTGRVAATGGADPDVGLVRFDAGGQLDPSFDGDGIVRIDLSGGSWDEAADVAVTSDGSILVAVQAFLVSSYDFLLARFHADGSLDESFGTLGVATADLGGDDFVRALALLPDGRAVLAGQAASATVNDMALAVFDPSGALDATFGAGGTLTLDFFGAGDAASSLAVQADGRIVVGGTTRNGTANDVSIARLTP